MGININFVDLAFCYQICFSNFHYAEQVFEEKKEGCYIFLPEWRHRIVDFQSDGKKILISKNHRILKTFKKNLHKSISSFLNAPLSKVHEGWTRRYINDESCLIFKESWIVQNNFFFNWAWNYMYIDHYNISKNTEILTGQIVL